MSSKKVLINAAKKFRKENSSLYSWYAAKCEIIAKDIKK